MTKLNSLGGNISLSIAHMAGMIDLAALPLWIGTLMDHYNLPPERAGVTVTMFLGAVVVASSFLAPRYHRLHHRLITVGGFSLATIAFLIIAQLPTAGLHTADLLLLLHAAAGLGAGSALSVTHGTFGRTVNPHRLFGIANVSMGVLAIFLFALLPQILVQFGGQALFYTLALIMAFAALVTMLLFPQGDRSEELRQAGSESRRAQMPVTVWPVIGVVTCLALNQAMIFSFVERLGIDRGFGATNVQVVLVVMGFVNLSPGLLAIFMQKRLRALTVGMAGPILQAIFALSITHTTVFALYALPLAFYVAIVIFTHVFLFGLLSQIDATGRAVAATPAMMMIGSAIGPALGGGLVAAAGYQGLGLASVGIATLAFLLILLAKRGLAKHALAKPVQPIPVTAA
jgi:predicted MFS family arabinose efflux permease